MSAPENKAIDIIDLQLMPDWVKQSGDAPDYSNFEGEEESSSGRRDRSPRDRERAPRRDDRRRKESRSGDKRAAPRREPRGEQRQAPRQRPVEQEQTLPQVAVRFLPNQPALENVVAQIKSGAVAYSVFSLARLFLEKPERYNVRVTGSEATKLYRLGEEGSISTNRGTLEAAAFRAMQSDFYNIETTEAEPIKGNFTNVARDRASGTLLGPTNHHGYQTALRALYEQRYSRRMSFGEYQRQIQIVNDPAAVEQWKEQARSVTTFTAKNGEAPAAFASAAETEKHFREHHLPSLITEVPEATIDGVVSRSLQDRPLARLIEHAWSTESRSPSNMMQELAGQLRQSGLTIFRHKRGMLFVSPLRPRALDAGVTVKDSLRAILDAIAESPALTRKVLAEKVIPASDVPEQNERAKMGLAADLRWLVGEGHVIEFNNGTLDLPRIKVAPAPDRTSPETTAPTPDIPSEAEGPRSESESPASETVADEQRGPSTPLRSAQDDSVIEGADAPPTAD